MLSAETPRRAPRRRDDLTPLARHGPTRIMTRPDQRAGEGDSEPGVRVECLSCGHLGRLAREDTRVGDAPLSQLTRRLVCSACGSRAVRASRSPTPRDVAVALRARMDAGRG